MGMNTSTGKNILFLIHPPERGDVAVKNSYFIFQNSDNIYFIADAEWPFKEKLMFNTKAVKNKYFIFKGSDSICFIADVERTQRILNGDEYIDWEEYSVFDPSTGTWRFCSKKLIHFVM